MGAAGPGCAEQNSWARLIAGESLGREVKVRILLCEDLQGWEVRFCLLLDSSRV